MKVVGGNSMKRKRSRLVVKILAVLGLGLVSALVAREKKLLRQLRVDLMDLPRKVGNKDRG